MSNSNVRIKFIVLNNGVHVVPTAHWENWKDEQSILNTEAIDNKVYFFLMISLINIPFYYFTKINTKKYHAMYGLGSKIGNLFLGWGFTIRVDKKELWKEVKQVLQSQELERYVTLFFKIGK